MRIACHPRDEMELMLLKLEFDSTVIPYQVWNEGIGSLYPGVQVPSYNERSIRVPNEYLTEAREIVNVFRATYQLSSENLHITSKWRAILELIVGGWPVLSGARRKSPNKAS